MQLLRIFISFLKMEEAASFMRALVYHLEHIVSGKNWSSAHDVISIKNGIKKSLLQIIVDFNESERKKNSN